LLKIEKELQALNLTKDTTFFENVQHIEEIHANMSSILTILTSYKVHDFAAIYHSHLTHIPASLKSMTSCSLHACGMTSIAGILKAVEKSIHKKLRSIYGENSYFECIHMLEVASDTISSDDATVNDWIEADLLIAQFNPVLKRTNLPVLEYKTEDIAYMLRQCFQEGRTKPLTLALDCTIDYIDSPRVETLLEAFSDEILAGKLNIVSFRSGLKFDLFGMDNYCGAPLFMIHNQDPKWAAFDMLLTDPALLTDPLSTNWFCLAYQNSIPYLEQYRKHVFENTRTFLSKLPTRLFNTNSLYRIVPVREGADPAFVDIKIAGPMHELRGAALVAGCLYYKCMEKGHPIFYRPSLGFYHTNFTMIFNEQNTTIRLTLGLDPTDIAPLVECFEMIDTLNGTTRKALEDKIHVK